ncbi:ankyrin repeat domain-containing protein [Flavonifractor plautii]|jgi:hypothetical protein|uniref:Uncharacterized protein n=1 Tax=Flavonifractor plautii TaxID=292800 RepID=A0A6I2RGI1_FLAPL|nr:ankyrin repeat domain-containing protein [Flavonifractor plautii]MSA85602.1 hypothetical protein [Odoribacter splanchnicus]MCG4658802.1 ankyrin repeat domain-containing protein [Flavonifractor plautii]MDB7923085.1 ankyrin repeat domain-containing protein [Flavonifractor plautii]MDC0819345.1 ankyrin repeat domain-containing protein [Flavonifractor plautii]MSB03468.1 hypothetical protein [Flavonifractor plautii]
MNLKKDGYGRTELSYAIIDHKIQEALLLLKQDMDVNDSDNGGHSYLFFAAQECEIEVVDALLKLGADPNIETLSGVTPLSAVLFASQKYSVDQAYQIVKLLLAAGANPDHKNRRGVSIRQLSKRLAPGKISSYICSYQ